MSQHSRVVRTSIELISSQWFDYGESETVERIGKFGSLKWIGFYNSHMRMRIENHGKWWIYRIGISWYSKKECNQFFSSTSISLKDFRDNLASLSQLKFKMMPRTYPAIARSSVCLCAMFCFLRVGPDTIHALGRLFTISFLAWDPTLFSFNSLFATMFSVFNFQQNKRYPNRPPISLEPKCLHNNTTFSFWPSTQLQINTKLKCIWI